MRAAQLQLPGRVQHPAQLKFNGRSERRAPLNIEIAGSTLPTLPP